MRSCGPRIAFSQKQGHSLYLDCVLEINKNMKVLKDSFIYILPSTEKKCIACLKEDTYHLKCKIREWVKIMEPPFGTTTEWIEVSMPSLLREF